MDFMWLIVLVFVLLILANLRSAIKRLENKVEYLEVILERQSNSAFLHAQSTYQEKAPENYSKVIPPEEAPPEPAAITAHFEPDNIRFEHADYADDDASDKVEYKAKPAFNLEQQFGARLPVWIGGISLALAGFFLVKYSIENQLVSPLVRVIFALIFGAGLLGAGRWVFRRPNIANGSRICQALTGAGLVCLYGALFAAGTLYNLVSPTVSFFGMIAVTVMSVILSISQGPAVAIFGMVGGFLTPIMVSSDHPSTLLLMIYLSALTFGLLYLARRQNWLWLSVPVYTFSLLWAVFWVLGAWNLDEAIFVSLYVIALMFIAPFMLFSTETQNSGGMPRFISYGGSLVSIAILSGITAKADFSSLHWSTFGLAGLASFALAIFRPRLYSFTPAVCGAVTGFMLLSWQAPSADAFLQISLLFTAVYFSAGCMFMFRVANPMWWSKIAILTLPAIYVISYTKYSNVIGHAADKFIQPWSWLALLIAAVSTGLTILMQRRFNDDLPYKERLLGLSSLSALGFLSWGLYLTLDTKFLMLAFALQTLAAAWLMQRYAFGFIRNVLVIAAVLVGASLIPYLQQLISLITVRDLSMHIVGWNRTFPALPIAGTTLLLFGAGYMNIEPILKKIFLISGGLLGLAVFYAYLNSLSGYTPQGMSAYRSYKIANDQFYYLRVLSLNITWLISLAMLFASVRFSRDALRLSALALLAYSYFQTVIVDLVLFLPNAGQSMGSLPVFNLLIPAFALPMVYMYKTADQFAAGGYEKFGKVMLVTAVAYLFLFVTFETSHFYHAPALSGAHRTLAEIYTYSVVWILAGIALLIMGTLQRNRLLRISALTVITGAVCKVFLYDASALEGLLRVLSFLGLGLSLIGLSYFYTRFVVTRAREDF